MWKSFPLYALVVGAYNGMLFYRPQWLTDSVYETTLMSGSQWTVTGNEALLAVALGVLYLEVLKATVTSPTSILDHVLSMGVFIVSLVEFMTVTQAGNSVFGLIVVMCLVDVVAGFTVTIAAARRDLQLAG